jgi:beta-N-acetylhexosaminidase/D-alanyl-D-alanine dipeptidase
VRAVAIVVCVAACSRSEAPRPVSEPESESESRPAPGDARTGREPEPERPDDLIDVTTVAPGIRVEMRYATTDNFTKVAVYPADARCLLRRDAAMRLARAQAALAAQGLGLKVWDCYRPFSIQRRFWQIVPDARYIAQPVVDAAGKPVDGSKHNRGAAIDVTLVDAAGAALEVPTAHDDFSPRAHRGNRAWSAAARANAAALDRVLFAEGFEGVSTEWWHYDAPGWKDYPLSDQPIE